MNTSKPHQMANQPERRIAAPGQPGIWSPATEALVQTLWQDMQVPSALELLAMPDLFDKKPPHRMNPRYLEPLRERVLSGRVPCGDSLFDGFIADVLSDDLAFESYFVAQNARSIRHAHPLGSDQGLVTPFQMATDLAWSLSVAPGVQPHESAVMYAAGMFYASGHFLCAHPAQIHKRLGKKATLADVREARQAILIKPLSRLGRSGPLESALLRALLLGWDASARALAAAGREDDMPYLQQQYARLLPSLHLKSTRLAHMWQSYVSFEHPHGTTR